MTCKNTELSPSIFRVLDDRDNQKLLASLGLGKLSEEPFHPAKPPRPKKSRISRPTEKRAPVQAEPSRRSGRIQALQDTSSKKTYNEDLVTGLPDDWDDRRISSRSTPGARYKKIPPAKAVEVPSVVYEPSKSSSERRKRKRNTSHREDHDGTAEGSDSSEGEEGDDYSKTYPVPTREDNGTGRLVFEGQWKGVFEPNLTPAQVLKGGAFAGAYFKYVQTF